MKDFNVIISGHLNTQEKISWAIELLETIDEEYYKTFVTHYSQTPDEIYELCDAVIYTKENKILNWDIHDEFTRRHGSYMRIGSKHYCMALPNASFAHLVSICDGIIHNFNLGFRKFHYISSDCDPKICKNFKTHESHLSSDFLDAVFYPFVNWVNTECFSFNDKIASLIVPYREYQNYSKLNDPRLEPAMHQIVSSSPYKLLTNNHTELGRSGFTTDGIVKNSRMIYDTDKFMIIPYIENKTHNLAILNEGRKVTLNGDELQLGFSNLEIKLPYEVKMFIDEIPFNDAILENDNQFGYVINT